MAEQAQDMLKHCNMMMILLSRLPQYVDTHGVSPRAIMWLVKILHFLHYFFFLFFFKEKTSWNIVNGWKSPVSESGQLFSQIVNCGFVAHTTPVFYFYYVVRVLWRLTRQFGLFKVKDARCSSKATASLDLEIHRILCWLAYGWLLPRSGHFYLPKLFFFK